MEEVRENKMGTQPIGDLLFKMAPTDVCGVIKGCEINNNAKCQGGWAVEGASPYI